MRDYIHVEDLAAAHVLALAALEQGSPTSAYNLGTGRGYSVYGSYPDCKKRLRGKRCSTGWFPAARRCW
ncbi:NAD-dependent epimerase/dehydratase family protein [Neomoorella thermoacetica]|uniref:NAD-dependent epimerase/dehydratase family protein n=1 Tax=Neomoorella thermoacetica TaxID=1525 RepID=UPI00117FF61F